MDFIKKIDIRLLIVALVFWLCSMLLLLLSQSNDLLQRNVVALRGELERTTTKLNITLSDNELINSKLGDQSFSFTEFENLDTKDYILLVFQGDELVFWNDNKVEINKAEAKNWKDKTIQKLSNGYYYYVSTFPDKIDGNYRNFYIAALYLVKHDFVNAGGNKNLDNTSNPNLTVPEKLSFSVEKPFGEVESINFNNKGDKPIYVYYDEANSSSKNYWVIFVLQLFAFFCLTAVIFKFCLTSFGHNYLKGFGILFAFSTLLFSMILGLDFPIYVSKIPLFTKAINSHIPWISVGKVLILLFLLLVNALFLSQNVRLSIFKNTKTPLTSVYYALSTFVFSVFTLFVTQVGGLLVRSKDTGFLLADLINNNNFIFSGFLGLLIIIGTHFLVSRWFLFFIKNAKLELLKRVIAVFVGLVPLAIVSLANVGSVEINCALFITFLVCFILPLLKFPIFKEWRLQDILLILVFTSFLVTFYILFIEKNVEKNERIDFAINLKSVDYAMPKTELQLKSILDTINKDRIYHNYFKSPILPSSELKDRILKKYFTTETFNLFNPNIQIFDANNYPLLSNSPISSFDEIIEMSNNASATEFDNLYQVNSISGELKYFTLIEIPFDNFTGTIAIQFLPSTISTQVRPKKTYQFGDEFQNEQPDKKYDYAIYENNILVERDGGYSYSKNKRMFYEPTFQDSLVIKNFDKYSHLFYTPNTTKTIVVSKPQNTLITVLSIFSIIFFVLVCSLVVAIFIISIFQFGSKKNYAKELFYSTFQKRISTTLFVIILFSFFLVGLATSIYFSNRFNKDYENKLGNKRTEILKTVDNKFKNYTGEDLMGERESTQLENYLKDLSVIHGININIYDIKGKLVSSSLGDIFRNGYIGKQMNATAFQTFDKKEKQFFINTEKIGKLNYKAAYGTLENAYGNPIGFLQLPNFESNKDVSANISSFISTILNAYVVILLLSSVLALYLTRSLTKPLEIIGQKINQIRLGQKNEELTWDDDDEIGELVSKYNDAVHKLESSARSLAESERQIAYEQMAKQISHEVRNPLTPMKLSIQQLQRISENNDPRLKEHVKRMCVTLIEQIDHLERVASEFSFFARAKEEKRELLDLLAILNSVIFLYKETRAIKIVKIFPDSTCLVLADRTQLTKVFHNILKNAMQAVRHKEQGVIFVNVKLDNPNSVLVSFTDNGVGIPPEGVEQVFQPNFTTKTAGMGLGLAICRNIIEDIDGEIWLESKLDEGTTFFIKLPLAR